MGKETEFNANINLELTKPDLSRIDALQSIISSIREQFKQSGLTPSDSPLEYPNQFLASSLTAEQRKLVDDLLAAQYASKTVITQEKLTTVPIEESYEPFIHLPDLLEEERVKAEFSNVPFHEACGEWAGKLREFWVRKGVAEKLLTLGGALKSVDLMIRFEDGFRPVGVQEGLFKRRVFWTQTNHPDWTQEQVLLEARSKTAITPRLASHKAGAAVDITIKKLDGSNLDLGNNYPEGGALVVLDCPYITQDQWAARQIFAQSAQMAGFTVYPGEDWHISYGDNLAYLSSAAEKKNTYKASYGPIKNFDRITGDIIEIYQPEELDRIFEYQ